MKSKIMIKLRHLWKQFTCKHTFVYKGKSKGLLVWECKHCKGRIEEREFE